MNVEIRNRHKSMFTKSINILYKQKEVSTPMKKFQKDLENKKFSKTNEKRGDQIPEEPTEKI